MKAGLLPRPRTPFFGRARSLARVRKQLGEHRLVTLTGVGGTGKTRLALRVAEDAVPELADDVGWVELAPLADARLVAQTVCSDLDIRLPAEIAPREALAEHLKSGRWLVVLDNCEHVTDSCADLVSTLLDRCSNLRILATSREALGVSGEALSPVASLSVPDESILRERRVDGAMQAASVQLFVDRARAVQPGFELTAENIEVVARLCRRLEGIPLALELAAARVGVLAVEQIDSRLDEGLGLLRRSAREGPTRHRTMQAALDWSHELLPEPERVLFRRLGSFMGQSDIEGCEAVCAGGTLDRSGILDLLAGLIGKSLVVVDDWDATARYRLLEPVRQFAVEQLAKSGELDEVRQRHVNYYLDMARKVAPDLRGRSRAGALGRLESAHDNLRRAWDYAVEAGDCQAVADFARALFWFWHFNGHFSEGRTRSEEALERLTPDAGERAELLYTAGALAWMQGDYQVASERLGACASLCRGEASADLLPLALRELAGVHLTQGELAAAAALYEDSVTRLRDSGAAWDLALALAILADVREGLEDTQAARELREEARLLFGKSGDPWGLSQAHFGLAVGAARADDVETARENANKALALQGAGRDNWSVGQILLLQGEIEARSGHAERAAERILEAIEAFKAVGDRTSLVYAMACLAECERQRGRILRAVRLAAAAHSHAQALEGAYPYALSTDEAHAQTVSALREAAGEEAFAEEWAAGSAIPHDAAIDFALDAPESRRPTTPGMQEGVGEAALQVFAFGPPVIYRNRRRLRAADWTFALPRELLFYLLLHGPRTKEQIGLEFWPEASEDQLRGRFRTTLYQLRRALGGTEWVLYRDGRYEFNRDLDYWFDVEAFESGLYRGEAVLDSDALRAADELQRAIGLYRGDFLEGERTADWASDHRERLKRRFYQALLTLGGLRTAEGAHDFAVDLYRRAVACDELDERAHRELAHSLARSGDRMGALHQLDELAELLRSELDAAPSAETLELRARLEQDPSL